MGFNEDGAFAIAVDAAGDAYVAGQAISTNFPVTQGAFQAQNNAAANQTDNAFVAKLNPAGSALIYSTYLGGSGLSQCGSATAISPAGDSAFTLSIDGSGYVYVAGIAFSSNFPVTQGAFQTTNQFSYTIGSTAYPGPTAFVTKLNPSGSSLVYSTYLGGSGGFILANPDFEAYGGDEASGLAIDGNGDAYVTGATASLNFPVTSGAYQTANASANGSGGALYNAFVTELNPAGSALLYSTYLGGNGTNPNVESSEHAVEYGDQSAALAPDGSGNVYIAGTAESANFPVTSGAFQTTIPAFTSAFIAKLALGKIVAAPGFTISGTAVNVTAGATSGNTSTITLTPSGGFTGSVTLTASITSEPAGALNPPTFSFGSTSPVIITGTSAARATLTINTTAEGGCAASNRNRQESPWSVPLGATLAALALIAVPRRRRWKQWLALAVMLAGLTAGISACGSSGTKGTCGAITPPTTSGVYTITVTGTSGATTFQRHGDAYGAISADDATNILELQQRLWHELRLRVGNIRLTCQSGGAESRPRRTCRVFPRFFVLPATPRRVQCILCEFFPDRRQIRSRLVDLASVSDIAKYQDGAYGHAGRALLTEPGELLVLETPRLLLEHLR